MKTNLSLEEQVCALEQAWELAELLGEHTPGSLYVHEVYTWVCYGKERTDAKIRKSNEIRNPSAKYFPAYTGDELGVLLPSQVFNRQLMFFKCEDYCSIGYRPINKKYTCAMSSNPYANADNEAQAKANLAIKGLREGWIKPEEFKYEH